MTKPLTERQQLARLKQVVQEIEATANRLIAVKHGRHATTAKVAGDYQQTLLNVAQSLKYLHDQIERAMEGRDGGQPE